MLIHPTIFPCTVRKELFLDESEIAKIHPTLRNEIIASKNYKKLACLYTENRK